MPEQNDQPENTVGDEPTCPWCGEPIGDEPFIAPPEVRSPQNRIHLRCTSPMIAELEEKLAALEAATE
jgi:hypothetical protein